MPPNALRRLPKLQEANLPVATVETVFPDGLEGRVSLFAKHETPLGLRAVVTTLRALQEYLSHFTIIVDDQCPCCHYDFLASTSQRWTSIEWTLTHGEGVCSTCGYPFRIYHRNVGEIENFTKTLPYHPSQLTTKRPKKEKVR